MLTLSNTLTANHHWQKTILTTLSASLLAVCNLSISHANIEESHQSAIDTGAPIAALAQLHSMQGKQDNISVTPSAPNIQRFDTAQGTPVLFVARHELPIVDIRLTFNAGSARDDAIKPNGYGLANLTASLLDQGTDNLNQDDIATQLEQLGVNFTASAYKDMFVVSLRSLASDNYLTPAVNLMTQLLSEANFPLENLERSKARILLGLQRAQENPSHIAQTTFMQTLYGNHPYAHPSSGTLTSVPTLTQADLVQFKNTFLVAKNTSIAITGDLTLNQAQTLAQQISQALPIGTAAPTLPTPKPLPQSQDIHIPFDSTQTSVIIGTLGVARTQTTTAQQQQTALSVANDVLGGGGFNARLMQNLRVKNGYTYGAYSSFTPMQTTGPFTLNFSTRNDKAEAAVNLAKQVLANTVNNGVSTNEVNQSKRSMINSFPLAIASNSSINGWLGMMGFYGLPDSYLNNYVNRVDNVTQLTANNTLQQQLGTAPLLTVTVGGNVSKKTATQK